MTNIFDDFNYDVDGPIDDDLVRSMSLMQLVRYYNEAGRETCMVMAAQAAHEIRRRDALLRACSEAEQHEEQA